MNDFISLMEQIENPGTFSVGGKLRSIPPGLKVKGLGSVSIPVTKHQAKDLIELSDQAPYGRGEETIVDTEVRNAWQISAENFELTNPAWIQSLQESIEQMGKQLGLYDCKINFEPYKLLIYEQGSFFSLHRDTEKIPNMFATLVINLPSEHEGGELIVSHCGQSQHYTFANNDGLHPDFVTFYADCYHEVKPITSGYRICLIYNLAIANRKKQPLLSEQIKASEEVSHFIQKWVQEKQKKPTLTYLLEHSYSEKNICLSNLKNADFAKASVLLNTAEKNGCQAFLCLVTYFRSSYGETPYYGRSSYYDDDDDDDDVDESDFEEDDVSEEEIYAHGFTTATGEKVKIQKINLEEDELLASIPLLEGEGRKCSISEATGNEGATKELWYHRGAIIIWHTDREFEVIKKTDMAYKLDFFKSFMQKKKLSQTNQQQIIQLANTIIEQQSSYNTEDISKELITLGDIELLKKFIHKRIKNRDFSRVENKTLIPMIEFCGWQNFEQELVDYLTPQHSVMQWLNSLLFIESLSDAGRSVIKKWAIALWKPCFEYQLTQQVIANVLQIISLLKIHEVSDDIIAFLSQQQPLFFTDTYGPAVIKALDKLQQHEYDHEIMSQFIEHVCQRIQIDFSIPPSKPEAWFREGRLNCTCKFCKKINQFLPDANQSEISFNKTLKRNLTHIEAEINKSRVDLSIVISRNPSNFDGLCRKNQDSYDHELNVFNTAQKIIKDLQRVNI